MPRFREYAVPARLSCGGPVAGVEPRGGDRGREREREGTNQLEGLPAAAGRGDGRGMGGRSSAMQSFVNVILASLLLYTPPPFHSATPVAKLALSYVLRPMLPVVSYAIISGLVSILRMVVSDQPYDSLLSLVFVPSISVHAHSEERKRKTRSR